MAKGKNKITIYRDWVDYFEPLTDEEAGKLIKHLLRYTDDQNPVGDRMTELLFIPLKKTLKRDLKEWEAICEKNRSNGMNGGRPKTKPTETQNNPTVILETQNNPIIDNDIDNKIIDIIKEEDISATPPKFLFRQELINYGFKDSLVDDWLDVRKTKKAKNTKTAFDGFIREVEKTGKDLNEILRMVVERSWQSFKAEWIKESINNKNNSYEGLTKDQRVQAEFNRINGTNFGEY